MGEVGRVLGRSHQPMSKASWDQTSPPERLLTPEAPSGLQPEWGAERWGYGVLAGVQC